MFGEFQFGEGYFADGPGGGSGPVSSGMAIEDVVLGDPKTLGLTSSFNAAMGLT